MIIIILTTEFRRKAHIPPNRKRLDREDPGRRYDRSQTAIDGKDLTGDVLAGVTGEENRGAFQDRPRRRCGAGRAAASFSTPTASIVPFVIREAKNPGAQGMAVMPCVPQLLARACAKLTTARPSLELNATGTSPERPNRPAIDTTLIHRALDRIGLSRNSARRPIHSHRSIGLLHHDHVNPRTCTTGPWPIIGSLTNIRLGDRPGGSRAFASAPSRKPVKR